MIIGRTRPNQNRLVSVVSVFAYQWSATQLPDARRTVIPAPNDFVRPPAVDIAGAALLFGGAGFET